METPVAFKNHVKSDNSKRSGWLIGGVFAAVLLFVGGLIALAVSTNDAPTAASASPVVSETPMSVQEAVELECAADLTEQMGLSEPVELDEVEFSELGDDSWAVSGIARYGTASGMSTTSDSFNCGVSLDDSGDVTVTAWTY